MYWHETGTIGIFIRIGWNERPDSLEKVVRNIQQGFPSYFKFWIIFQKIGENSKNFIPTLNSFPFELKAGV